MIAFRKIRYYIFLRDVVWIAFTAFGGPQAHIARFLEIFVKKRAYLTEDELLELHALCQILPGPTSTQTITAIGFKIGGGPLAYLTLLVWILPAVSLMTLAALGISHLENKSISLEFTRFIQPMAIGFISFAAYQICVKVLKTKTAWVLMVISAILSCFFYTPWLFPIFLLVGGAVTSFRFKKQPAIENAPWKIRWENFIVFCSVLILATVLASITGWRPMKLFSNFYRSGALIFGGGQVLIPLLFSEFVNFKKTLTANEFLTGFSLAQVVPGPVFAFASFVGTLSMREYGLAGEIWGAVMAALGIFLPGTFLIFFVIRFWNGLKKYRAIRASLEGINAVSAGMMVSAAFLLFQPLTLNFLNIFVAVATFALQFTRVPQFVLILLGLALGLLL